MIAASQCMVANLVKQTRVLSEKAQRRNVGKIFTSQLGGYSQ